MKPFLLALFAATAAFSLYRSFAVDQIDRLIAKIESHEGFVPADTTVEKDATFNRAKLKASFPEPGLDDALARLTQEEERLAPRWTFPSGARDARLEAFAVKGLENWHPGAKKFMRSVMDADAWRISKNKLGIPLSRSRRGYVLYKMEGENLCRQQSFSYTETFDGTGYQPSNGVRLNYIRFLGCK